MGRFQWLFFDLFDTLCALDESLYFEGKHKAAEAAGLPFDAFMAAWRDTAKRAGTGLLKDPFERASEALKACGVEERSAVMEVARLDIDTIQRSVSYYPGAAEALGALRGLGFRLGLISNATATTAFIIRPLHLRDRLDLLVFSYEEGVAKPDPEIFRRALSRAGCPEDRALFIGDGANGELDAAAGLGMATLRLDHAKKAETFRDPGRLSGPGHRCVTSFNELMALLDLQEPASG